MTGRAYSWFSAVLVAACGGRTALEPGTLPSAGGMGGSMLPPSGAGGTPTSGMGGGGGIGGAGATPAGGSGAAAGAAGSMAGAAGEPPVGSARFFLEQGGVLYSVNERGGDRVELARSPVVEVAYVPLGFEGERLVLSRYDTRGRSEGNGLFSMKLDGSELADLSPGFESIRSPRLAGDRVIFGVPVVSDEDEFDVYSVKTDGTARLRIVERGARELLVAGNRVIFGRFTSRFELDLYSVTAEGSDERRLTKETGFEQVDVVVGDRIVFGISGDLYAVDADGGGRVALVTHTEPDAFEGILSGHVLASRSVSSMGSTQYDVFAVALGGGTPIPLAPSDESERFVGGLGRRAVLQRFRGTGQFDLYAVDLDGSGLVRVAGSPDDEYFVGFAGGRIVFDSAFDRTGVHDDISSIAPDGTGLTALTGAGASEHAAALIGDHVLFHRYGTATDLYAIGVGGGAEVLLSAHPREDIVVGVIGGKAVWEQGEFTGENGVFLGAPSGRSIVKLADSATYAGALLEGCVASRFNNWSTRSASECPR